MLFYSKQQYFYIKFVILDISSSQNKTKIMHPICDIENKYI